MLVHVKEENQVLSTNMLMSMVSHMKHAITIKHEMEVSFSRILLFTALTNSTDLRTQLFYMMLYLLIRQLSK